MTPPKHEPSVHRPCANTMLGLSSNATAPSPESVMLTRTTVVRKVARRVRHPTSLTANLRRQAALRVLASRQHVSQLGARRNAQLREKPVEMCANGALRQIHALAYLLVR